MALLGGGAGCESAKSTSFIRLHAKYRERGDVLTRDNHEIMRAIAATFRFILAFCGMRRRDDACGGDDDGSSRRKQCHTDRECLHLLYLVHYLLIKGHILFSFKFNTTANLCCNC